MSVTDLRKVMNTYISQLKNAISSNAEDIEEAITTSNNWLKKIYQRLGVIQEQLGNIDNNQGSGSGNVDLSNIENLLNQIRLKEVDLDSIETLLTDIKNKDSVDLTTIESMLTYIKNNNDIPLSDLKILLQNIRQTDLPALQTTLTNIQSGIVPNVSDIKNLLSDLKTLQTTRLTNIESVLSAIQQ